MPPRLTLNLSQRSAPLNDDRAFARAYVEEVMKTHLPQDYWSLSPEGRMEMTMNGRRYARHFGIRDVPSQMMFITLMWEVGANFFMFSGFKEIAVSAAEGPAKIDAFFEVESDLAAEAIMNADPRYWYPEMAGITGLNG